MNKKLIWVSATRKDGTKFEGTFKRVCVTQGSGGFWVNMDGQEVIVDKVEMETREIT